MRANGSIAESVLQNGGKVTGVEPQFLWTPSCSTTADGAYCDKGHDGQKDEND